MKYHAYIFGIFIFWRWNVLLWQHGKALMYSFSWSMVYCPLCNSVGSQSQSSCREVESERQVDKGALVKGIIVAWFRLLLLSLHIHVNIISYYYVEKWERESIERKSFAKEPFYFKHRIYCNSISQVAQDGRT